MNIKRKIFEFLTSIEPKLFGKASADKSNLRLECWELIEILEPYENQNVKKIMRSQIHRKLFKVIFYFGCVQAVADKITTDLNVNDVFNVFVDTLQHSKHSRKKCSFDFTKEEMLAFRNFWWSKEKYFDTDWEDKWIRKLINAGKIAVDVLYESKAITFNSFPELYDASFDKNFPSFPDKEFLLPPLESLLNDKKFIESSNTGMMHFSTYLSAFQQPKQGD